MNTNARALFKIISGIYRKSEHVVINIDVVLLKSHLVESPRIGRYPRPVSWLVRLRGSTHAKNS